MKKNFLFPSLFLMFICGFLMIACYKKDEVTILDKFKQKEKTITDFLATLRPNENDATLRSKCSARCPNGSCSISCRTSNCATACGCDENGFAVCQVIVIGQPMPIDPNIYEVRITVDEQQEKNILATREYLFQNNYYELLEKFDNTVLSYNSENYQNNLEHFNNALNTLPSHLKESYKSFVKKLPI